jgi:cytochrome c-type biogenesis protein CcmF
MIAELGHVALILAFVVTLLQFAIPMIGARRNDVRLMLFGDYAALAQLCLIAFAFTALISIFVHSDFSVKLAALHSHSQTPFIFKITGVWANHEGSILLWVLILSVYGALVPVFGRSLPLSLKARAISIQGLMGLGFLAFILFTSNPFERLIPVPTDGQGLNPLLQDIGLAIHPPFLYLGYVGLSMPFAFAVAALIEGRVDAVWAKWLRPWVLLAWSFLTIGITLGSFWAYYELGWGGWWMWDPVENVSFMPWLAATALLHSIMVLGTRHSMASWTILLSILAFSLSLIGTFVVRSGILVSVHSFAVDPERGVFIFAMLLATIGGALGLYALRANTLRARSSLNLVSKDGALVINNLLLIAATITVFLGTFYPLMVETFTGAKISVGAPYFNMTFAPLMSLLLIFMAIGPLLKWRSDSLTKYKSTLRKGVIALVLIAVIFGLFGKSGLGGLSLGIAAFLAFGTIATVGKKIRWGEVSKRESWGLLRAQPAATFGFIGAHIGMAIFAAGVTSISVWESSDLRELKVGESIALGHYEFTLNDMTPGERENYQFLGANISITKGGANISDVYTERRYYPVREMVTTEAGLHLSPTHTLFAAIGEGNPDTGWIVRVNHHPFVIWIWIGALLMALAGFVSLCDRRFRYRSGQKTRSDTLVTS